MAEINTAALRAQGGRDARALSVTGRGRADTGRNKDFIKIILIFLCQVGYTNLAVFSLCEKQINRKMLNIRKRIFINLVFFSQKP